MSILQNLDPQPLGTWFRAVNVLLAIVIVGELALPWTPPDAAVPRDDLSRLISDVATERFELPPKSEFSVLTARPLFSSTRRPFLEPAQQLAPVANATSQPDLSLVGTVIAPGQRSALLQRRRNGEFVRLEIGMSDEGWELVDLSTNAAVLQREGRRYELELSQ